MIERVTDCDGNTYLYEDGLLNGRPAIVKTNGVRLYYVCGQLHRIGGPAIENEVDNEYSWWLNGQLIKSEKHCENGNIYREYYVGGKRHRKDGAAVELVSPYNEYMGYGEWWIYGIRHREDGPAVEDQKNGYFEWWNKGNRSNSNGPAIYYRSGMAEWINREFGSSGIRWDINQNSLDIDGYYAETEEEAQKILAKLDSYNLSRLYEQFMSQKDEFLSNGGF